MDAKARGRHVPAVIVDWSCHGGSYPRPPWQSTRVHSGLGHPATEPQARAPTYSPQRAVQLPAHRARDERSDLVDTFDEHFEVAHVAVPVVEQDPAARAGEQPIHCNAQEVEVVGEADTHQEVGHEVERRCDVREDHGEDRLVHRGHPAVTEQPDDEPEQARQLADEPPYGLPAASPAPQPDALAHRSSRPFAGGGNGRGLVSRSRGGSVVRAGGAGVTGVPAAGGCRAASRNSRPTPVTSWITLRAEPRAPTVPAITLGATLRTRMLSSSRSAKRCRPSGRRAWSAA